MIATLIFFAGVYLACLMLDTRTPMKRTTCRSCGAHVIWARHVKTGKGMPLDAEPDDRGLFVLVEDHTGPKYMAMSPLLDAKQKRYTSHFATCPDADKWRK